MLDARLERVQLPARARLIFAGAVLAVLVVGALAVNAPQKLEDARQTFSQGRYLAPNDLRERLTSTVDNGRVDNWQVALDGGARELAPRHRRGHLPADLGALAPGRR